MHELALWLESWGVVLSPLGASVEWLTPWLMAAMGGIAILHLVVGGRLEDHGATLGTTLCGAILGASLSVEAGIPAGMVHRATGGAMVGGAVALWIDALSVRLGLVVTGGVAGALWGELLGLSGVGLRWMGLVGALTLPWVHAPWPRATAAMVAALVLGWLRLLPAGAAGVIFVWGLGMALQIWRDSSTLWAEGRGSGDTRG